MLSLKLASCGARLAFLDPAGLHFLDVLKLASSDLGDLDSRAYNISGALFAFRVFGHFGVPKLYESRFPRTIIIMASVYC